MSATTTTTRKTTRKAYQFIQIRFDEPAKVKEGADFGDSVVNLFEVGLEYWE